MYRSRHGASPLAWSPALASSSQQYAADAAARGCSIAHSDSGYGENLFEATSYPKPLAKCADAVQLWYGEVSYYNFDTPSPFTDNQQQQIGHFTQLVSGPGGIKVAGS